MHSLHTKSFDHRHWWRVGEVVKWNESAWIRYPYCKEIGSQKGWCLAFRIESTVIKGLSEKNGVTIENKGLGRGLGENQRDPFVFRENNKIIWAIHLAGHLAGRAGVLSELIHLRPRSIKTYPMLLFNCISLNSWFLHPESQIWCICYGSRSVFPLTGVDYLAPCSIFCLCCVKGRIFVLLRSISCDYGM